MTACMDHQWMSVTTSKADQKEHLGSKNIIRMQEQSESR